MGLDDVSQNGEGWSWVTGEPLDWVTGMMVNQTALEKALEFYGQMVSGMTAMQKCLSLWNSSRATRYAC